MRQFLKEFQAFISKGNVMDLAVAVIIGAAFSNIVNSLVKDIVTTLRARLEAEAARLSKKKEEEEKAKPAPTPEDIALLREIRDLLAKQKAQ